MNCPTCPNTALVMSERKGVEIDYCPKCRGVWLDRGELDKIIERSEYDEDDAPQQQQRPPQQHQQPYMQPPLGKDDSHYGYQYKKRKSWLAELFD